MIYDLVVRCARRTVLVMNTGFKFKNCKVIAKNFIINLKILNQKFKKIEELSALSKPYT